MTSPVLTQSPSPPRPGPAGARDAVRPDIQGLRALAVGLVLLYHFWPGRLSGGYVGVDVFFVISGFLITSHLLRHPVRSGRDLVEFWGRRIRRLVPAATVVLVATVAAGYLWLPETVLEQLAQQAAASSLYVENWVLAETSTDYLAAGELHSAVQHFWSLSVEEQFYIFWPVLVSATLAVAALLGSRRGRRTAVAVPVTVAVGLGLLAAGSLAWSAWFTASDAAAAYFVTSTRIWELAIGGVLAAAVHAGWALTRPVTRAITAWLGLGLILAAAVAFSGSTAFPGTAALLPTLGAVALIAARSDGVRLGPSALWRSRPAQLCGDLSYSIYLWHWPVLVIAPFALGDNLRWPHKLVLVAAVPVLSGLTKRYVEDGLRFHPRIAGSLPRTYLLLAVCLAASLAAAGALWLTARSHESAGGRPDTSEPCFGAAAFREPSCPPGTDSTRMSPVFAKKDKPDIYRDRCTSGRPFVRRQVCTYGDPDADVRIALVGNSHAGHWQPPVARAAREHGLRLDTYLISECYTVDLRVQFGTRRLEDNCLAWNDWARREVAAGDYDLVIMSDRTNQPLEGVAAADRSALARAAYTRVIRGFLAAGSKVLVIRDTPAAAVEVPDCVAQHRNDLSRCATPERRALEPDPLAAAASALGSPDVAVLDVNDLICSGGQCHAVVGGAITYFDHGHLTKTFARTLYPEVSAAIEKQLRPAS